MLTSLTVQCVANARSSHHLSWGRSLRARLALLAIVLAACSQAPAPEESVPSTTATTTPTTTTSTSRSCEPPDGTVEATEDPAEFSIAASRSLFSCSEVVVLASGDGAWTGALIAAVKRAPLLIVEDQITGSLAAEVARLDPDTVYLVGLDDVDSTLFSRYEVLVRPSRPRAAPIPDIEAPAPGRLWLVPQHADALTAVSWAAAYVAGDHLIAFDFEDPRALPPGQRQALRDSAVPLIVMGDRGPDFDWQLEVARSGNELPGGGQLLFPGRRLVALYGNPTTPNLGVLGEQGPAEAVERVLEVSEPYGADGLEVLPTFEIIATVASAVAGRDGNYSEEMSPDVLRPWVEAAEEAGIYVVLDLQPGRTDFLTQAQRYEEFLRMPHVGLALDPEWRLEPNQVHLRQVGSVDADEINRVSEWLSGIVREEALPQKLLLLHQFKFSMITNREQVRTPPELAVVIQMDGQGPLATKYSTWNAITAGTEGSGWLWGWKNFYDEDSPTATPQQVLDLVPRVVFVSYQ